MSTTPTEYVLPLTRRTESRTALVFHEPLATITPQEATIYNNYRVLFRVSKAVQSDATRLMLCLNEWLIRISYVRDIHMWRGSYQSRNGLSEMEHGFGAGALRFLEGCEGRIRE